MHHEFTAIIARDGKWSIGCSPEVPGANGQGLTHQGCRESLAPAVALILEDRLEDGLGGRLEDGLRGAPAVAIREVLTIQ